MPEPELDLSVYLVTDRRLCPPDRFLPILADCLDAGVTCVQVREKGSARQLWETACQVLPLARARGIPVIINDRLDVALALGADGVHLGQSDLPAAAVRQLCPQPGGSLGPDRYPDLCPQTSPIRQASPSMTGRPFWLGVSVASEDQARAALASGADHLGVGALFPTATKTDAPVLDLPTLGRICRATSLPVVGIGGITPANAAGVLQAGARGLAVVSCVWQAADPPRVVEALVRLVATG